ncbi:hypothetical protein KIN20_003351, partial [Parelaphostrongylus tenuis]
MIESAQNRMMRMHQQMNEMLAAFSRQFFDGIRRHMQRQSQPFAERPSGHDFFAHIGPEVGNFLTNGEPILITHPLTRDEENDEDTARPIKVLRYQSSSNHPPSIFYWIMIVFGIGALLLTLYASVIFFRVMRSAAYKKISADCVTGHRSTSLTSAGPLPVKKVPLDGWVEHSEPSGVPPPAYDQVSIHSLQKQQQQQQQQGQETQQTKVDNVSSATPASEQNSGAQMTKKKLLSSDSEGETGADTNTLAINKSYANRYDNWRRLEELQKSMSSRISTVTQFDESSSSEEEIEWSAADEMRFLRTLSALKEGDESIYDEKSRFWTDSDVQQKTARRRTSEKQQQSPMYLKDYERKLVLEKEGQIDESDGEVHQEDPNYFDEQERIRNELRRAVENHETGVNDDNSDEFLIAKVKTAEEKEKEEEDFYSWLKSHGDEDVGDNDFLRGLKKAWKNPEIDEGEKFLRDYLVNRDFIPSEKDEIVTFDDIQEIEEDEKDLEMQRNFEHKYNFRFEEPDQEFIKQYPRTVGDSLRKHNTKRKEKREEYKERKEQEKRERKQEIREMKKVMRTEIERKLERLRKMAGDDIQLNVDDLTGDFDPREYDKRMAELFNEEYYGKGGATADGDVKKPEFSDMDEFESDSSDYDNFCGPSAINKAGVATSECDTVEQNGERAKIQRKNDSRRKRKRNGKLWEALRKKKPIFDPNEKTFEEYFNEYYALDYEDIIGDQLTRFKYRQVVPNDFGLSVGEILSADDRQLNAWASIKKATGYRTEHEDLIEVKRYKKKAADVKKKQRIFSTDFGGKKSKMQALQQAKDNESDQMCVMGVENKTKETAFQARRKELDLVGKEQSVSEECRRQESTKLKSSSLDEVRIRKKKSKKNKLHSSSKKTRTIDEINVSDSRLKAYGINPKKFKNKLKF